jgi:hypothetical protein
MSAWNVPPVRARRLLGATVLDAVLVLGIGLFGADIVQAQQGDLYNHTSDRTVVTVQVRSALPSAIEGLELLVTATDRQGTQRAVNSINNTYRYLRAAQESITLIHERAKYPDPLAPVYAKRMWEVRVHMLKCLDVREALDPDNPELVAKCADELSEGIRKLRILVGIMP